jgi:arylsulfatase B
MTRRREFLAGAAGALAGGMPALAARRPNIVLLFADDLGYGELGCQGNPEIPTPHIDSIARQGVRFTQGYVTAPFCSPSRAGILTGRYQTRFGHELNPIGQENLLPHVGLPASERTIAQEMKANGYRTAMIGKWHLGGVEKYHPLNFGFDEFYGFLHEGHFFQPRTNPTIVSRLRPNEPPYDDNNPLLRGRQEIIEEEYYTEALAREACSFIDKARRDPFFLYVTFNAVHSPMQARPRDIDRFAHIKDDHRRMFAAMLASLDDAVGSILGRLRQHRIENDTLVVFLSDNGGPTAELTSSNKPLRAGKGQLYEGGIRVPFLMQFPGRIKPGMVAEAPVTALDLLPTFMAAAGGKRSGNLPLDGSNLLPWLNGKAKPPANRPIYWRFGNNAALRWDDWKLVRQGRPQASTPPWELYNLRSDVTETKNLAASETATKDRLLTKWEELNAQMVEPTLKRT